MKTAALKKSSNSSSDDYYEFLGNKVHRLALVNWDFVEIGQVLLALIVLSDKMPNI